MSGGQGSRGIVRIRGFAADDGNIRAQRFCRNSGAGEKAASRHWRANDIEVGNLFQKFERRRALSRDHAVIIEGMNQHRTRLAQNFRSGGLARLKRWLAKNNLCSIGFDGSNFHLGSVMRHNNPRANAAQFCGQRERRAMVAGGMSDHAARCFGLAQRENRVGCATNLK